MAHKIITKRAPPVTLDDMLLHLKEDVAGTDSALDALTLARFDAACDLAQHYTGRAIGLQTLEKAMDQFPAGPILLPLPPAISVVSITYVDPAGVLQECGPNAYVLDDYSDGYHWAIPVVGGRWPEAMAAVNTVKVRLTTGYTASTLPGAVRAALLLILGHLHENNQAASALKLEEIPIGVYDLLGTVKIWEL